MNGWPNRIFVKPLEGRVVKDPETMEPLPADGKEVPNINYWHRRANDKDVTITLITLPKKDRNKEAGKAKTK